MKKNIELLNGIQELSADERLNISGGDEFSESVVRLIGYTYMQLRKVDWSSCSWFHNARAQR
jgi:hypothetical protein